MAPDRIRVEPTYIAMSWAMAFGLLSSAILLAISGTFWLSSQLSGIRTQMAVIQSTAISGEVVEAIRDDVQQLERQVYRINERLDAYSLPAGP